MSEQSSWDARYAESPQIWSGRPNVVLAREAAALEPGRALDLGCGEGADAVWLAQRGWRVTAVDISGVALERAAVHAGSAGVADRIEWQRRDLAFPSPDEVVAGLDLAPGEWEVLVAGAHERTQTGPDGRPASRTDSTVMARRRLP
jgi:SAM-dependent methyltransferase